MSLNDKKRNRFKARLEKFEATIKKCKALFEADGIIDSKEQKKLERLGKQLNKIREKLKIQENPAPENIDGQVPTGDKFKGAKEINVTDVTRLINKDKSVVDEYGDGISHDDVDQNWLGDCSFLSALAAVAKSNPAAIKKLITGPNKDGSYNVKLYQRGGFLWMTHKHTIVKVFPKTLEKNGQRTVGMGDQELWVMLVERAFAQLNGGYDEIWGGWGDDALETLTGEDATYTKISSYSDDELFTFVDTKLKAKVPMTTTSINPSGGSKKDIAAGNANVVTNHVYYVLSISKSKIKLRNPHNNPTRPGGQELELSLSDYRSYFYRISYTE